MPVYSISHKPFLIPAVYMLIRNQHGEILLLERKNTSYRNGQLTLPSGHVESSEGILESGIRELQEETGLFVQPKDLRLVHVMKRKLDNNISYIDFYLIADSYKGIARNVEPEKCLKILWAPPSRLPSNTIDHVIKALDYIQEGVQLSEWK